MIHVTHLNPTHSYDIPIAPKYRHFYVWDTMAIFLNIVSFLFLVALCMQNLYHSCLYYHIRLEIFIHTYAHVTHYDTVIPRDELFFQYNVLYGVKYVYCTML